MNDILVEWAEEQYDRGSIMPSAFVPLYGEPHQWLTFAELKKFPQFSRIIHECLVSIPWTGAQHPVGVMLELVYPWAYTGGWNGLFKDIEKQDFLPILASKEIEPSFPSWDEREEARVKGIAIRRTVYTHIIVPSEIDAVVVAAMTGIFNVNN